MSRLVDPTICPDCRAPLDATATCTGCGLQLAGPLAQELWSTMIRADSLLTRLRATVPTPGLDVHMVPLAPSPGPHPAAEPGVGVSYPKAPPAVAPLRSPRGRVSSASASAIVLGLGALCLLVAAVVFVAVAWSDLGLGAKTAILLGLTALLSAVAVAVTLRTLRGAAETFWSVVAGMVVVDLAAAHAAALPGMGLLSWDQTTGIIGTVLLGLGVGVGLWVAHLPLRRVRAAEGLGVLGAFLATLGWAWAAPHPAPATTVAVPVLVTLAVALVRPLRATAYGVAAVAVLAWLALLGDGLDAMATVTTDRLWWSGLHGWPLLAAAVLAAAAALRAPAHWARVTTAGGALVALALLAAGPDGSRSADLVTGSMVVLAWAAVAALAPRVWREAAAYLTAVGLVGLLGSALLRPLLTLGHLPTTAAAGHADLGRRVPLVTGPAPWTAAVVTVVVVAAMLGLRRHVPAGRRTSADATIAALAGGLLALGLATVVLELGTTIAVAALSFLAALLVTGTFTALRRLDLTAFVAGAALSLYLLLVMLRVAVPSHLLAASLTTAVVAVLAGAYARVESDLHAKLVAPGLAGVCVLLGGFAALHWPYVAHLGLDARAIVVAATAVVAGLAARLVGRTPYSRVAVESAALVVAAVALTLPLHDTTVAMVATMIGTALALVASLYDDRAWASWIGVVVLAAATVLRVVLHVGAPELYTLPAALLLLIAGVLRIRRNAGISSFTALGSGLTLALAPSLLLALGDPVSLRGVLIGVAGLAVLAVGIVRHWSAPLVAGAGTVALLALRHLGPIAEAIPRWASLGLVGVALLLVGVTWEARRRNLSVAGAYLAELR